MGGGSPGGSDRTFIPVLTQLLTCPGTSLSHGFFTREVKAEAGVSDKAGARGYFVLWNILRWALRQADVPQAQLGSGSPVLCRGLSSH